MKWHSIDITTIELYCSEPFELEEEEKLISHILSELQKQRSAQRERYHKEEDELFRFGSVEATAENNKTSEDDLKSFFFCEDGIIKEYRVKNSVQTYMHIMNFA